MAHAQAQLHVSIIKDREDVQIVSISLGEDEKRLVVVAALKVQPDNRSFTLLSVHSGDELILIGEALKEASLH